jgi:hypothetical protein
VTSCVSRFFVDDRSGGYSGLSKEVRTVSPGLSTSTLLCESVGPYLPYRTEDASISDS